ncbi:MAG TPA: patatin-like phospholipase family protein [Tepidisphaeraceae bacterium]|nr:patatin-like phospholipase family protein [Tepidisphaeraceae bacterium]
MVNARAWRVVMGFLASSVIAGCTSVNKPLNDANVPLETRQRNHTRAGVFADMGPLASSGGQAVRPTTQPSAPAIADQDGYFVGIAISGGGLRSANFAAACMFQLQRMGLLSKADYISGVSGGSITAAYYCLSDPAQWNPGNVQKKLTHPFGTDIFVTAFQPWNALALMFTDWDSTDILASTLDQHLFSRKGRSLTFADLREDRPRLLINATDLQSAKRFTFCNEAFDDMNSDLSRYPIAHAVAASGAFPVFMHAKTLRDFSTVYKQYRHFIDGGIIDNLGVQSLLDVYSAQNRARGSSPVPYPKGAVLIVIDAGTRYDARLSDKGDIGFFEKVKRTADLSATALLSRAKSATLAELVLLHSADNLTAEDLRQKKQEMDQKGFLQIPDRDRLPIRVVHLSLANVRRLSNLPFPSFSESLDSISTFYNIDQTEAYRLYQAADLLVNEDLLHAVLQQITEELNGGQQP